MSSTTSKPREDVTPFVNEIIREQRMHRVYEQVRKHIPVADRQQRPPTFETQADIRKLVDDLPFKRIGQDRIETFAKIAAIAVREIEFLTP